MEQGKLKIINIGAVLFLLLIFGAALILGLEKIESKGKTAHSHFASLWDHSLLLFEGNEESRKEAFEGLREGLTERGELRSFILYGETDRAYYVFGRNSEEIYFATPGDEKYRSTITLTKDSPFDVLLSRSSATGLQAEAVYSTLNRGELFRISRGLLLGLSLLCLVLVVFIGIASREKKEGPSVIYGAPPLDVPNEKDDEDLYSKKTSFCRPMFLRPRLESELKRAAAFDQDLVLAFVRCIDSSEGNEGSKDIEGSGAQPVVNSTELHDDAMSFFPFKDLLFEFDSTTFAVILPNTDIDQGIELLSNFQHHIFEKEGCSRFDTAAGLSSRNGRLIDHERIITETRAALRKAVEDPETHIIGFRPDPGKYRSFVARKKPQS